MTCPLPLTLALLALLACGCREIFSVFPFYEARDVVTDDALVGRWAMTSDKDAPDIKITKQPDGRSYLLAITNKPSMTDRAEAHLFRLDGTLFIDWRILELEGSDQVIKPHLLVKVSQIQPTLKMARLSDQWLKRQLVKQPKLLTLAPGSWTPSLGVTNVSDVFVISDTKTLRKILLKHKDNPEAFGKPGEWEWHRLSPTP